VPVRPGVIRLASPPSLLVLGFCAVNCVYTAIVAWRILHGDLYAVVPPSVARRLVIGGVSLSGPLAIAYNAFFAVAPLVLLRLRDFGALASEAIAIMRARLRGGRVLWPLIAVSLVIMAVYLASWPEAILPFEDERVRWFTDQVPDATPVDQPLLVRAHYLASLVGDVRYTLPLLNALFPVALVWGLAIYFGGQSALPVSLAALLVFTNPVPIFYSTGADAEIPAAVFGLLGVLAVGRQRWRLGFFLLWFGLLFKITGLYYAGAGAAMFLWSMRQGKVGWRELKSPVVLCMAGLTLLYYLNYAVYVVHRGVTYVVHTSSYAFFTTPATVFAHDFVTTYAAISILIALAWILVRERRSFLICVPVLVFALRCTALPAGGYYTLFFIPVMAWLVSELFVWGFAERTRVAAWVVPLVVVATLAFHAESFVEKRLAFTTPRTMQWNAVVGTIDAALPSDGEVFYRKVSPKYDLLKRGRRDAAFIYTTEDPAETERRLTAPGAKIYLAPVDDLDDAARRRLTANGFRPLLKDLGPRTSKFVLWSKAA
jgi:hypothetical protein